MLIQSNFMNIRKSPIKLSLFILISVALSVSCDSEDEGYPVVFSGTVRYIEDNTVAAGIPVELELGEVLFANFEQPTETFYYTTLTDAAGRYTFELNSKDIPSHAIFFIYAKTDSLLNFEDVDEECARLLIPAKKIVAFNEQDIFVDHLSFLQISFVKVNHESTDHVRYRAGCNQPHFETSATQPDLTVLDMEPYSIVKDKHTRTFMLVDESDTGWDHTVDGIQWKKGDTTKITVEY